MADKVRCRALLVQMVVEHVDEHGETIRESFSEPMKVFRPLWGDLAASVDATIDRVNAESK